MGSVITKVMKKEDNIAKQSSSWLEKGLWLLILLVFIAGFAANYFYFQALSIYLRVVGWIFIFGVMLALGLLTKQGQQALAFVKAAKAELRKVVWPTRQETTQITIMVMAVVLVVALALWGVDAFFMWAVGLITT